MKHLYVLLLVMVLAWLGSGRTSLLAQEPPRSPLTPPSEETTENPGVPLNPQLIEVQVDLGAGGPNIHVRLHPAWLARYRPSVRVGQARTEPQPEAETAPPPQGSAEDLQHTLERALDRAKPPTQPSP
jgi:hypothetical protein